MTSHARSDRATRWVHPYADGRPQHESSSLRRELPAIGLDADDDVASARPERQLGRTGRCERAETQRPTRAPTRHRRFTSGWRQVRTAS